MNIGQKVKLNRVKRRTKALFKKYIGPSVLVIILLIMANGLGAGIKYEQPALIVGCSFFIVFYGNMLYRLYIKKGE